MPLPDEGELQCMQCKTMLTLAEETCWRCGSTRLECGPLLKVTPEEPLPLTDEPQPDGTYWGQILGHGYASKP